MTRIITALILGSIFIYITLYAPSAVFTAVLLVIAAICYIEYARMVSFKGVAVFRMRGMVAAIIIPLAFLSSHYAAYLVFALILAGMLLSAMEDTESGVVRAMYTLYGAVYIGICFTAPMLIRAEENGPLFFLLICTATWGADIGAYYVGKARGRTKLAPAISPGKTVEGFAGGIVTAVICSGVYAIFFFGDAGLFTVLAAGLIGGIAGPAGDLAESQMKRYCGVKDSGTILPGHGGFLDRADALMFSAPLFYVYLALAGYVS